MNSIQKFWKGQPGWYAVYTRPKAEKYVSEKLVQLGFESYCPVQKQVKQWVDRKKIITTAVVKGYVFVRVEMEKQSQVLSIPGVMNYVKCEGRPAMIRDAEMEIMMEFLGEFADANITTKTLHPDQRVRIVKGVLTNYEAIVEQVTGNKVKLFIESLGIFMQATVPLHALDHINPVAKICHKPAV